MTIKLDNVPLRFQNPPSEWKEASLVYYSLPDGGAYVVKNRMGKDGTHTPAEMNEALALHNKPAFGSREHMLETLHDVYRSNLDIPAQKLTLNKKIEDYWQVKD